MAASVKLIHYSVDGAYYQYPVVFSDDVYTNPNQYTQALTTISDLVAACQAVDQKLAPLGLISGFWQTFKCPIYRIFDYQPLTIYEQLLEVVTPLCWDGGKAPTNNDDFGPALLIGDENPFGNFYCVASWSGVRFDYGGYQTRGYVFPGGYVITSKYNSTFNLDLVIHVLHENCLTNDGNLNLANLGNDIQYFALHFEIGNTVKYQISVSNENVVRGYSSSTPYSKLNNYDFPPAPEPEPTDTDPYSQGGNSGDGGGTGDFDGTSDSVGIPGLPSLSATDTGFITLFNPSLSELQGLASYMWGSLFDISTFKKIFADPIDCILGLSIVPVSVPNGATKEVKVGNIGTGINMTTAAQQYVEVNCGTINVNEFWGSYLDYSPYTKAEIYLPYIGTHAISVDDIMAKSVQVVYHIDILSGACNAYVKCGSNVLYEFIGQCSSSIPINGNDWTNVINGVLNIAGNVGSMVATGGATAPMAAVGIASTAVNSFKPDIEKSGSLSGTGGMLAIQKPYLILTRPKQALPNRQNSFIGYPSFTTKKMGNLQGYTVVESTHLQGIPATEEEYKEIETILKDGVIF